MELATIRRPPRLPELPDRLGDAIAVGLNVEHPDPIALEGRIAEKFGISRDEARAAMYRVTAAVNARFFPALNHLEIIHTEGCNLACTYCFEKDMLGYRRMRPEVATAGLDLFFAYSRNSAHLNILHFGGEPTLNMPGVRLTTEYAEKRATEERKVVSFNMTSNALHMTDETIDYLATHKIQVLVSVDGLAEDNDRYRVDKKGRGTFARVMEGMRRLKERQRWMGIKITVMPETAPRLFEAVRWFYDHGVNQFTIGYATGIDWPDAAMEVYAEQMGQLYQWYAGSKRPDLKIAAFDGPANQEFFGCQAGRNSITISVDGEISPCAKILAVDNKQLVGKLGDVTHGLYNLRTRGDLVGCRSLKEATREAGMDEFRGGCFASNYDKSHDLFAPNPQDYKFSVLERQHCGGCATQQ
jgi:uncharacterized protein